VRWRPLTACARCFSTFSCHVRCHGGLFALLVDVASFAHRLCTLVWQAEYPPGYFAPLIVLDVVRSAGLSEDVVLAIASRLLTPSLVSGGVPLSVLGSTSVLRDKLLPKGPVLPSVVELIKDALTRGDRCVATTAPMAPVSSSATSAAGVAAAAAVEHTPAAYSAGGGSSSTVRRTLDSLELEDLLREMRVEERLWTAACECVVSTHGDSVQASDLPRVLLDVGIRPVDVLSIFAKFSMVCLWKCVRVLSASVFVDFV
jgi:hypothetical protein